MLTDEQDNIPFCYFRAKSTDEWLGMNKFLRASLDILENRNESGSYPFNPSDIFYHPTDYLDLINQLKKINRVTDQHILFQGLTNPRVWKSLQAQVVERLPDGSYTYEVWLIDVDLLKRAQEYLSLFQQAVEYTVNGVTIVDHYDKEMRIIYANPAFYELTGYSPEESLGRNCRFLQGDDRDQEGIDEIRLAIKEQRGCTVELRNYRKDGSLFWNELTIAPLYNDAGELTHYVGLQRDVTTRKNYEHQLQLTAAVFDNMEEGVFITNENGQFLEVNQAFLRITGYDRDEVIGQSTNLLKSGYHDSAFYQQMWDEVETSGKWKGRIINRKKNGEIFEEFLSIAAVSTDGHPFKQYISTFSTVMDEGLEGAKDNRSAYFDPLTHLPNRILFLDRLNVAIERANRNHTLLAVCSLDVDDFQQFNADYGHDRGDRLLIELSNRIQERIRKSDTVSRPSGDEFMILFHDLQNPSDFHVLIADMMNEISKPYLENDHVFYPAVSVGVTFYPLDGVNGDELLRNADKAMYRSKATGKNHYTIFNAEQDQLINNSVDYARMHQAINNGEFVLYYQPKVEMTKHKVYGVEALIRWNHPDKGILPPGTFLPDLQHTDFMILLDDWVKEEAIRQLESWQRQGIHLKVSINISAKRLKYGDFPNHLKSVLQRHPRVNPGDLELEILETDELGDLQAAKKIIEAVRELGVHVSLDDFGTGYSSLTYLSHLPLDILKIDQSFVRHMSMSEGNLAIISAVIELSRVFQCDVIAEGVETIEQGKTLIQLGCELAQGYLIARPMPPDFIPTWIQSYEGYEEWQTVREMNVARYLSQLFLLPLEHRQWVDQMVHFLQNVEDVSMNPPELDPHACHFGRWYDHVGKSRFGEIPQMETVRRIHEEIHEHGRYLIAVKAQGNEAAIIHGIPYLYELRDNMLNAFHDFVITLDGMFGRQISKLGELE